MTNEFYEDFQYDSCVSRGICSIGPITSALQSALIMYLKFIAKYMLGLEEQNDSYKKLKTLILNLLPISVSYPEFTESTFELAMKEIYAVLSGFEDKDEILKDGEALFSETKNTIQAIRYGEKIFLRAQKQIPAEVRDLYNIMLVIAKSIAINILDLESLNSFCDEGFNVIINILNEINLEEKNIDVLVSSISSASSIDHNIMLKIRDEQEKRYGKQGVSEVSFSTTPAKAVLVVGSNIRELEIILENFKEENIDVYTHDDMMLAHTFPKFSRYENLKGQFGLGLENCLLDFATFPGPIILTKHSLHNIDNLFRGRLFTTDFTCPKGVIRIVDNDYSEVIKSAKEAKGFKSGKHCESVLTGCYYDSVFEEIKLRVKDYKQIFLIALDGYSLEQKIYFERLLKLVPDDILVISFSYESARDNSIYLNTCYDNLGLVKIFDFVKRFNLPITAFIPRCDRNSISQMIYLKSFEKTKVYVGKCTPILLNPSLMSTLQELFFINSITSAKRDLEDILGN